MHDKHTANSRKKNGNKNKQENLRSGSTETFSVEALCGQGALVYSGDVKVLLTQRSSNQVLLTKRSGNQVLLQNGGRVMHPLFILQNGAHTTSVSTKWVWDR